MENMTHCTKMGADKSAENTPKCPKIYLPKLSVQAQKVWHFGEKRLHWASIVPDCVFDRPN